MKILMFLSKPFFTDPRVYREAKTLTDAGHIVSIVFWDRKDECWDDEMSFGVRVIGIQSKGFMGLLPNDLLRNPLWWLKAYQRAMRIYREFRFDVVHCHDLDTLVIGFLLKKKLGVKLVYDSHDLFGYMIARDQSQVIVKLSFWLEKKLLPFVDFIITTNEPFKNYFNKICDKPVFIVMNCKDLVSNEYVSPVNKMFTVSYIGVLNHSRMFPELVDIVGCIPGVRFRIAGRNENLYDDVKERCLSYESIEFLGTIHMDEVIKETLASDVVLCMISPADPNNRIALANKQFEAMVCGRPIICTRGTYAGDLVERLHCGLLVDYNAVSVEDAITTLRDDPVLCRRLGMNALAAALSSFNWANEEQKLIGLYKEIGLCGC